MKQIARFNLLAEKLWILCLLCVVFVPAFSYQQGKPEEGRYNKFSFFCPPHDQNNFRCVKYIKNYDGDTIRFHIPGIHPLIGKDIRVRVANIDTFEMKAPSVCEKQKAIEAQKFVEHWLKKAQRIDLENVKRGHYFRIVADVTVDGVALGPVLLKQNLALPYGKKPHKKNPCHAKPEVSAQNTLLLFKKQ